MPNFRIDRNPPLSDVIYRKIVDLINAGELQLGEKLPGEKVFAQRLKVSRTALREALQKLELDGFVSRKHGVGTFVISNVPKLSAGLEKLDSITDFIRSKNHEPGTIELEVKKERVNQELAELLNMRKGDPVTRIERVRTADNQPFAFDIAVASNSILDEAFSEKLANESLFGYLENEKNIMLTHSHCDIYAENASPKIAEKLQIRSREALQVLEQVHYTKENIPVLYGKSYIRTDMLRFHLIRRR